MSEKPEFATTAEEVWREAFGEWAMQTVKAVADQAATSVIRTAMEAYAAERDERLGEALYGLSARLLLSGFLDDAENHAAYEKVVAAFGKPFIAANQHHGGNDADT